MSSQGRKAWLEEMVCQMAATELELAEFEDNRLHGDRGAAGPPVAMTFVEFMNVAEREVLRTGLGRGSCLRLVTEECRQLCRALEDSEGCIC